MVQPEMQPEDRPQDGLGKGVTRLRPGDLAGRVFPLGDWGDPAPRLDELYQWAERGALDTAAWYLAVRVWKRRCARMLRMGTTVGAATGAALPLLDLTGAAEGAAPWGYTALLLAAVCMTADRFFGVTSGWMRDVATAQAVQRRLQALQFEWASECVREVLGPAEGTASEATERCLSVLRRFSEDVDELVRAETADWMMDFRTATSVPPAAQRASAGTVRPEPPGHPHGRFATAPGTTRPNMPRQRPPEPW